VKVKFSSSQIWSTLKACKSDLPPGTFDAAAKFKSRIDLVHSLRSINFENTSASTSDSYFVLLKLGLVQSCVEALEVFLGEGRRVKVFDDVFYQHLSQGTFNELLEHIMIHAERKTGKVGSLSKYLTVPPDPDLSLLVRNARNITFHASATANSLGLASSRRRRELLLGLANSTLTAVESEFEAWFLRQRLPFEPHR
jgi:hypothetical protein